jgi:Ni,Fe-hydrogenase maturation factor
VAHRVADLLGEPADVRILRTLQVTPEIAAELVSFDCVIFVDADVFVGSVRLERLTPASSAQGRAPLSHSLTAAEVLALAEALLGFHGTAWICRVPSVDFGTGCGLSAAAEAGAHEAAAVLRDWFRAGQAPRFAPTFSSQL